MAKGPQGTIVASKKGIVIAALVEGMTMTEAAEATGVKRATIADWKLRDPEFQRLLEEANEQVAMAVIEGSVDVVRTQIKEMGLKAREVLEAALDSDDDRLALQAAGMVFRLGNFEDKDVKVTIGLEQHIAALGDQGPTQGD
jgi:uncharacterized protein YpbB